MQDDGADKAPKQKRRTPTKQAATEGEALGSRNPRKPKEPASAKPREPARNSAQADEDNTVRGRALADT